MYTFSVSRQVDGDRINDLILNYFCVLLYLINTTHQERPALTFISHYETWN